MKEAVVINCATHGYGVAVASAEENVAFEVVQWGLAKSAALAQAEDLNERPEHVQRTD